MDGHDRNVSAGLTIGQLARRTGLSVKTIRWYSDQGLVPPAGRSAAGYRLYDVEALARLELVRTLRRLDIDLPPPHRRSTRPSSGPGSSPTSRAEPTGGLSATGNCWESSTAGRRSRRSSRPSNG